jgi:hypothetical protein
VALDARSTNPKVASTTKSSAVPEKAASKTKSSRKTRGDVDDEEAPVLNRWQKAAATRKTNREATEEAYWRQQLGSRRYKKMFIPVEQRRAEAQADYLSKPRRLERQRDPLDEPERIRDKLKSLSREEMLQMMPGYKPRPADDDWSALAILFKRTFQTIWPNDFRDLSGSSEHSQIYFSQRHRDHYNIFVSANVFKNVDIETRQKMYGPWMWTRDVVGLCAWRSAWKRSTREDGYWMDLRYCWSPFPSIYSLEKIQQ